MVREDKPSNMPKANKVSGKSKRIAIPQAGLKAKKDFGLPKLNGGLGNISNTKNKKKLSAHQGPSSPRPISLATLLPTSTTPYDESSLHNLDPSSSSTIYVPSNPLDAALTTKDSSKKAFTRELLKVITRSDIIIQVLDARDPGGTRSRWVEDEVRRRAGEGKRLVAVVNKIDLVSRENLEGWLRYLRHEFPTMPFKASTQSQRSNLSQSAVPVDGNKEIPKTSSSIGAPALLHLLKQYSLSRPHQTLTVGIIGYPNVGKSSLINSLKRSRACAVAAMPGKTRVVQEVVLDKGVKVLDCPGVVLEDFGGREGAENEEERRRRLGEVMLRNCLKVEEIEDPIAPVEVILSRVDPEMMQKIYTVPAYSNVTEFLVTVALTRGRLGKGGIPDLPAAATSVLRDWNAGKIPYHTSPPTIHPSTRPAAADERVVRVGGDGMQVNGTAEGGDAILQELGQAWDLEGFLGLGGAGEFEGAGVGEEEALKEEELEEEQEADDYDDGDGSSNPDLDLHPEPSKPQQRIYHSTDLSTVPNPTHLASTSRLFAPDELSLLPADPLDRKAQRQQSKKRAKKAREHAEETLDFGGLVVGDLEAAQNLERERRSKKQKQKEKGHGKGKQQQQQQKQGMKGQVLPVVGTEELEFQAFLNQMGADVDDDEMMM